MAFTALSLASSSTSGMIAAAAEDAQLAVLQQAAAIEDIARQAALTAGADWPSPLIQVNTEAGQAAIADWGFPPVRANGEGRGASDDEMSEASPDEVAARQAQLNLAAEEFLRAEETGVVNADGEALYTDQTWRPVGYDSSATSAGHAASSAGPQPAQLVLPIQW